MACDNCGTVQGPFLKVDTLKKVCGPVEFDKQDKLVGRAKECLDRRDKLDAQKYGAVV